LKSYSPKEKLVLFNLQETSNANSPAMISIVHRSPETFHLLLDNDLIDFDLKNKDGKNVIDLCMASSNLFKPLLDSKMDKNINISQYVSPGYLFLRR
jgi:hypothetical protein